MQDQRGMASVLTVILVIVIAAALGAGAYFGYDWWQSRNQPETSTPPATTTDPYVGWETYTDAVNLFTLRYPTGWTVSEGNFSSTHGQTLKDIGLTDGKENVFLTVRTNPDADLKTFVDADGVTEVKTAQVENHDGYAAVTTDSFRVYISSGGKIYMFTFPGAKSNSNLSQTQVNIMTSIKFTAAGTGQSTSETTSNPVDIAKAYYGLTHSLEAAVPSAQLTSNRASCLTQATTNKTDLGLTTRAALYAYCGLEGEDYFQAAAPVADITFTETKKTSAVAMVDLTDKAGQKIFTYTLFLEDSQWQIDKIDDLRS